MSIGRVLTGRTARKAVLAAEKDRQEDGQHNRETSTCHDEYVAESILNRAIDYM